MGEDSRIIMVTITGIADTHGLHDQIKPPLADILVVAGDFCNYGVEKEVIRFNAWLGSLEHKHKIVIAGNHDIDCEGKKDRIKALFSNAIYLDMESVKVIGINFFGCPWTPEFCEWAFMYPKKGEVGKNIWNRMPEDTNVLISHGPPSETQLGWTKEAIYSPPEDCGCPFQRERILQLKNLKASFCGHIHCGVGLEMVGDTSCMNVSVVNEEYRVVNHGTKFEIVG